MKTIKIVFTLFVIFIASSAYAQFNIKDKFKEKSTNRAETRVDEGIDKGIDKLEEGVGKLFKKKKTDSEENTEEEQTESGAETEQAKDISEEKEVEPAKNPTTLKGYSKYDFVPGDKVLYFEDFSQDAIGDFPALWTTNGGGEVKTINIAPGNWFHMNKEDAVYCYTKPIAFPENFIMEFDIIPDGDFANGYSLTFYEDPENTELTDDLYPGKKGVHISFEEGRWYTKGYNNSLDLGGWIEGESSTNPVVLGQVNHVIIWVQNRRLRIYHKGAKAFDMPTNIHAGTKFNRLRFSGWSTHSTPYVTNLKITTAAPDTRSKLITEGKLVSYGIYFDVNKDVVKAESFGTLSEIAKTLKENSTVKVKIIGYTDSDGDDAKNLDLSKRRAAAVKNALSTEFGVEGARIQTDGKGESEPISPNTTAEGKAKNRRVEFIKI
jgi:outer membrane protein OmpA-like peptidoglycan-associated protein